MKGVTQHHLYRLIKVQSLNNFILARRVSHTLSRGQNEKWRHLNSTNSDASVAQQSVVMQPSQFRSNG